jgi:hypothetical protein
MTEPFNLFYLCETTQLQLEPSQQVNTKQYNTISSETTQLQLESSQSTQNNTIQFPARTPQIQIFQGDRELVKQARGYCVGPSTNTAQAKVDELARPD